MERVESLSPDKKLKACRLGVGLRSTHYLYLEQKPSISVTWFEAICENYMDSIGRPREMLRFSRQDYPVALQGVSMSLGSAEGPGGQPSEKLGNG